MYGVYDYGVEAHTHNLWQLAPASFFYLQQDYRRHVWDINVVDQPTY